VSYKLPFVLIVVHFEKRFILVPLHSLFSVYYVVLTEKDNHGIHRKHGEDTEQESKKC
jgi:hypothetical protein